MPRLCALCFRHLDERRWSNCALRLLWELMRMDAPPYADLVCEALHQLRESNEAALCEYCTGFVKERTVVVECVQTIAAGRLHGMQLTISHILSGGCLAAPTRPYFLRCMALLEDEKTPHPFFLRLGDLRDRIEAHARLGVDYALIRWLFDGQPRVLNDSRLAKRIRQTLCAGGDIHDSVAFDRHYYERHCEMQRLLRLSSDACRFCVARLAAVDVRLPATSSYQGALVFGTTDALCLLQRMNDALLRLEEEETEDLRFCVCCQRFSVVSYEYHCALRAQLQLSSPAAPSADAYYAHLLALKK